jgi:peptidoglycan/xylan/chitin deacetylase (PgdA/CDA1 family)
MAQGAEADTSRRVGSASAAELRPLLHHRHSWVWMVVRPGTKRIWCVGDDPTLPAFLRAIGFEVSEYQSPGPEAVVEQRPDAILIDVDQTEAVEAVRRGGASLSPTGVIAVVVAGGARTAPRPVSRAVRAFELAGSPLTAAAADLAARRLARGMERARLHVSRVLTGDRVRVRYGLGSGGWLGRLRFPAGSIVVGTRDAAGSGDSSVVDAAIADAAQRLDNPLQPQLANVFESGKLGVELADAAEARYFLSVAAPETSDGLGRSRAAVEEVLRSDPPRPIRERVIPPVAAGTVGRADYVLEPRAGGRHPHWMTPRLWEECLEFLAALHELPAGAPAEAGGLRSGWPNLNEALEFAARHAAGDVVLVERLGREVESRIEGIPLGGGHGDFWSKNLIVDGGELRAVLDWEWAARDCLPLLDLMDLTAQLGLRRSRGLPPGPNFLEVLWPLAQDGGDARFARLCALTGISVDTRTLEGITIAHWLLRTARAGLIAPHRVRNEQWLADNVGRPIAQLRTVARGAPRPRGAGTMQKPSRSVGAGGNGIRTETDLVVLGYHSISERWPAQLSVTPTQLREQLEFMLEQGYTGATFSDALLKPPNGPTLVITFDDAYRSVIELARPILARFGLSATVFVPTAFPADESPIHWRGIDHWLGSPYESELIPMSWEQLDALRQAGWELGSHSHTHPRLTQVDDRTLEEELSRSRRELEERLGITCRSLAYPYGDHDARVVEAARTAGYETACTFSTWWYRPEPLRWPRIGVHRRDYSLRFRVKVSPGMRRVRTSRAWELVHELRNRHARP